MQTRKILTILGILFIACGAALGSDYGSWVRVTLESGEMVDVWFPDAIAAGKVAAAVATLEGWSVTMSEDADYGVSGQSTDAGVYAAAADKKPQDDYEDRINSKYEKLNERLNSLIDTVVAGPNDLITEEQKERLQKARGRANRARERVHAAGGLKRAGRSQEAKCGIQEYVTSDPDDPFYGDGNDDGICEKGEFCLTVLGGVCPYQLCGKKNGETCQENCNQNTVDSDANNFDPEAVLDIEEALDDLTAAVDDACDTFVEVVAEMPLVHAAMTAVAAGDDCSGLPITEHITAYSYEKRRDFRLAANIANATYNTADSGFNQDFGGFNISAAGIPFAVAAGVLQSLADSYEEYEDQVTAEQVTAACECLKQTSARIGDIQGGTADIQEDIAVLQKQIDDLTGYVEERFAEMLRLLNTPQGQRPDWPATTGATK